MRPGSSAGGRPWVIFTVTDRNSRPHDNDGPEAWYAVETEAELLTESWDEEVARGLELGLPGADSIVDKRIPTCSRGELPHFAGINTIAALVSLADFVVTALLTGRRAAVPVGRAPKAAPVAAPVVAGGPSEVT